MTLTGFCEHVRVLERAGLVRRTRHGRENTLELSAKPLHEVGAVGVRIRAVLEYKPRFGSTRRAPEDRGSARRASS
jgi:predicted MarR family transcription regulator